MRACIEFVWLCSAIWFGCSIEQRMYAKNEGCSDQVAEGKEWDGLDERHVLAGSPGTFHSLE